MGLRVLDRCMGRWNYGGCGRAGGVGGKGRVGFYWWVVGELKRKLWVGCVIGDDGDERKERWVFLMFVEGG